MPNVIDDLRIKIQGEFSSVKTAVDAAVVQLERLQQSIRGVGATRLVTKATVDHMNAFAAAIENVSTDRLYEISNLMWEITSASMGLNGIQNIGQVMTEETANAMRNFGSAVETLNMDRLRELASLDLSQLNVATGLQSIDQLNNSMQLLAERLDAVGNALADTGKQTSKASTQIRTLSKETKSASKSMHSFHNPLTKILKSIGRIAFYRLVRGAIKAVTQGLSEGIKEMYHWAELSGNVVAPNLDKIAAAADYLRRGFASMWSPLINYATPVIEELVKRFVEFFNTVQRGVAALTGADHWTKALWVPKKFDEETNKAKKSAKELKDILMDFDELNVIKTPTNSSSGKEETDYSGMFETVYEQFDTDQRTWGQRLADLFNKAIDSIDFKKLGAKLGNGINWLTKQVNDFLSGAHFYKAGYGIGTAIAEMIGTIDWGLLGDTLATGATDVLDAFIGAIEGFSENDGGFKIGRALSNLLTGAIVKISDWISKTNFAKINDSITNIFVGIIEGIKLSKILAAVAKLIINVVLAIPEIFLSALKGITMPMSALLRKLGWSDAADWIDKNMTQPLSNATEAVHEWREGIVESVDIAVDNLIKEAEQQEEIEAGQRRMAQAMKALNRETKTDNEAMLRAAGTAANQWSLTTKHAYNSTADTARTAQEKTSHVFGKMSTDAKDNFKIVKNSVSSTQFAFEDFLTSTTKTSSGLLKVMEDINRNTDVNLSELRQKVQDRMGDVANAFRNCKDEIERIWGSLNLPSVTVGANVIQSQKQVDRNYTFDPMLRAGGGFPSKGELFIAGEVSPELVGSLNGRPAVVSGNEISGISEAIREQGMMERQLMSEFMAMVRGKQLVISPSAQLGQVVARSSRLWSGVTG